MRSHQSLDSGITILSSQLPNATKECLPCIEMGRIPISSMSCECSPMGHVAHLSINLHVRTNVMWTQRASGHCGHQSSEHSLVTCRGWLHGVLGLWAGQRVCLIVCELHVWLSCKLMKQPPTTQPTPASRMKPRYCVPGLLYLEVLRGYCDITHKHDGVRFQAGQTMDMILAIFLQVTQDKRQS